MMADHYEARVRMFRQARSALIYPAVVLTIALAVVMLLSIFLLPKFAELLKDIAGRGAELPVVSWMLMAFADFVAAQGWWLMPAAVIGSIFAFFRIYATKKGKAILDEIGLAVPVLGGLLRKLDIARFARTLSVLMESGVDIDSSLRLTSDVMRMVPYRRAVRTTRELVLEGAELSEGMAATRRFTPDVLAIVSSGEESGKLPLSLEKLADDYEEQVEYAVKNLGQLVQPLLMIFLGLIVLFIILAVILPYISVISSIR
jgi:type II secretory pathway component PulF